MPDIGLGVDSPHRETFDNGVRLVVLPVPAPAPVAVTVAVRAGSRDDPAEADGLAHLVEHLMFARAGDEAGHVGRIEALGGAANAVTRPDVTEYSALCPAETFMDVLAMEGRRMSAPEWSEEALRRELPVMRAEITDTMARSHGGFPWAWLPTVLEGYETVPPHGNLDHLERLRLEDADRFRRLHYTAPRVTVAVVGEVEVTAVTEQARRAFGSLPSGPMNSTNARFTQRTPTRGRFVEHRSDGVFRPEVAMAIPLPPRDAEAHVAHEIVAELLSGRGSRNWRSHLPTLLGVSVSCGYNARFPGGLDPEPLVVRVRLGSVDECRRVPELLSRELRDLSERGPAPEELQRCRAALILRHLRERDDVGRAAEVLARSEVLWHAADSHLSRPTKLAAVTADRVAEAARELQGRPRGTILLHGGETT